MFSCVADHDSRFSWDGKKITDLDDAELANFLASDVLTSMNRDDRRYFVELLREREVLRATMTATGEHKREATRASNKLRLGVARRDVEHVWLENNDWPTPKVSYPIWVIRHNCRKWTKFSSKIFSKMKPDGREDMTMEVQYFFRVIPFVNLMVDLFFDNSPIGRESVKSLLDILGLLNALLLGVAISIMTSVAYTDAAEGDVRYGFGESPDFQYWPGTDLAPPASDTKPNYYRAWITWWPSPPSTVFLGYISSSSSLFFIGVLCVVYMYADMVSKMPEEDEDEKRVHETMAHVHHTASAVPTAEEEEDFENSKPPTSQDMFQRWWIYSKFGVLAIIAVTMLGCIYAVFAVLVLCVIKYPDYYILHYGEFATFETLDPIGMLSSYFKVLAAICGFIVVMSCGMGTSRRYSFEDDMNEARALKGALKSLRIRWESSDFGDGALQKEYIVALRQAFWFFMACDEFVSAKAVLNSLRTSGLLGDPEVMEFVQEIADSGDAYYGIKWHVPEDVDKSVQVRMKGSYYEKLR